VLVLRLIGVELDDSTIASAAGLSSESDMMMLEFEVEKNEENEDKLGDSK
jgi:hypothetical protein